MLLSEQQLGRNSCFNAEQVKNMFETIGRSLDQAKHIFLKIWLRRILFDVRRLVSL